MYLRTSPEHAMKRLLAGGSGDIYEVAPVFRADEPGRLHNPEFTLVEWYRLNVDHHALMSEVEALLARLLGARSGSGPAQTMRYEEAFRRFAGFDPFSADDSELRRRGSTHGLSDPGGLERDGLLDFLMAMVVQPALPAGIVHVWGYPPGQSALAQVERGSRSLAERFETFVDGVELANGYHELRDPDELAQRFEAECARRAGCALEAIEPDLRLLDAMRHGLPPCSGVALGFDRLVMLAAQESQIRGAISFPFERA